MFWEAADTEGNELPVKTTFDPSSPDFYKTHKIRTYPQSGALSTTPDHITLRMRVEPVGLEVVDELIAGGYLDAQFRDKYPKLTAQSVTWTAGTVNASYVDRERGNILVKCVTNTNFNVAADKFPAPTKTSCAP
jgi:hypothetical protein